MRSARTRDAIEYIRTTQPPITAPELAYRLGCSIDTAANVIKRLVKRGILARVATGQYAPPP